MSGVTDALSWWGEGEWPAASAAITSTAAAATRASAMRTTASSVGAAATRTPASESMPGVGDGSDGGGV